MIKQSNEELGAGKYIYHVRGLSLVPINWDTLRPRKLKMEAWLNDTTKKQKKENQEKKETGYKVFLRIVLPYECVKD